MSYEQQLIEDMYRSYGKVKQLIMKSKLSSRNKTLMLKLLDAHPEVLLYTSKTAIHELLHHLFGHFFVYRKCGHCYVYNMLADFEVEKAIEDYFPGVATSVSAIAETLTEFGLTSFSDLAYWDCSICPFNRKVRNSPVPSLALKCTKIRYQLESLIHMLTKEIIPQTHRNYVYMYRTKQVILPKVVDAKIIGVFVDSSTSVPLPVVKTSLYTAFKYSHPNSHIKVYTFSDICVPTRHPLEFRRENATNIMPVIEQLKNHDYNIVITDFKFDDAPPDVLKKQNCYTIKAN